MPKPQPDPVTAAVADPVSDFLAALPAPTPDYDPAVEITIGDLGARNNWSKAKASSWLSKAGWQGRDVMVKGRKATAFRPVKQ